MRPHACFVSVAGGRTGRSKCERLRAIPDRASGDAAKGLPVVGPVAVAMAPVAAVIVVPVIVAIVVVVVVIIVVVRVALVVRVPLVTLALAFALTPHLHDVVGAGELWQGRAGHCPGRGSDGEVKNCSWQNILNHRQVLLS